MSNVVKPALNVGKLANGNPFANMGSEWCQQCKMVVDASQEANHRKGIYTFKVTCDRCGAVVKWGAYPAPLVNTEKVAPAAVEWVQKDGKPVKRTFATGGIVIA